jgi:ribokinase
VGSSDEREVLMSAESPPSAVVVVAGSLMMDLVVRTPHRPKRGETVFGTGFDMFLGGKGFNQAVAARRLGASVSMVGRVGRDSFGHALREALQREGIDDGGLSADLKTGTGVAIPIIEPSGENSIICVPRSNMCLTSAEVERSRAVIEQARVLLLQLEIPVEASLAAARLAVRAGARVLLNTAPVGEVPDELRRMVDVLIANEPEATALTGVPVRSVDDALDAARRLRARADQIGIVTLGERGAVLCTNDRNLYQPAHAVSVCDTTGAGDAFCAAFAVRLAECDDVVEALAWGNAAGGCAVTTLGAEPSLPTRAAVLALLGAQSDAEKKDTRE